MTQAELDRRFDLASPPPEMKLVADMMRDQVKDLAKDINEHLPESREKSLAITKLEEVLYWTIAAIVRPPA